MNDLTVRALNQFDAGPFEVVGEFPSSPVTVSKLVRDLHSGKFYVLKQFDPEKGTENILIEHRLLEEMALRCVPLTRPVLCTLEGKTIATVMENDVLFAFALIPYLVSTPQLAFLDADIPLPLLLATASALANLHRGLQSLPASIDTPLEFVASQWLTHTIPALASDREFSAKCLTEVRQSLADLESLPVQLVHSDVHPGNMTFKNNRVTSIFDFKACHRSYRLWDVAYGATYFSLNRDDSLDRDKCRSFLAAYAEAGTTVTKQERYLFPITIKVVSLVNLVWVNTLPDYMRKEGSKYCRLRQISKLILESDCRDLQHRL